MNASFTRKPTTSEYASAARVSNEARTLVAAYAKEVGDSHEWPNADNVENTKKHLLAYIAVLEQQLWGQK